ncbi:unnamed protein product [Pedinophyceae sp. YPF-701]|nr:unnamed protein product [Pedinophyceae sp. YPF-701]
MADASSVCDEPETFNDGGGKALGRSERATVQDAVYGVLFTLSKEKYNTSWKFALADVFLNWAQLMLLLLPQGIFPWDLGGFGKVAFNLGVPELLRSAGYAGFNVVFYSMFAVLAISLALCAYVAQNFRTNKFPYVWPIKVLRFAVSIFFRTFYITVLNVFAIGPDCRTVDGALAADIFPDKKCMGFPHGITALLAILAAVAGGVISFLMSVAEASQDPLTEELLGSPDSVADVRFFSVITVVTVLSVFLDHNVKAFGIVALLAGAFFVYLMLRKAPFFNPWVNCLQAGLYGTFFWTAAILLVVVFAPEYNTELSMAWYSGLIPAGVLFAGLMHWRWRAAQRIAKRFFDDPDYEHSFVDEYSVELVSRCMRRRDRWGNLEPGWFEAGGRVLKAGLAQFPHSTYLMILNANYLAANKRTAPLAAQQLAQVRKRWSELSMGDKFQLFVRDRENKQRSKSGGQDAAMDLVSYVEFQNNFTNLLSSHSAALKSVRSFWRTLLRPDLKFSHLNTSFTMLAGRTTATDKIYEGMLQRYPKNVKLLRSYGKFCESLKHDPWKATHYYNEADKIEDMQAEAARDAIFGDPEGGDGGAVMVDDTTDAVLVITDTGVILMANKVMCRTFGYQVGELEGANVSSLMPQPFSGQHNGYLRNYKLTGKSKVIGKVREVIALHKDKSVLPVKLSVSKVPSDDPNASDAFMGVMRPVEEDLSCGTAWLTTTGTFLATNRGFTDCFGYDPKETVSLLLYEFAPADGDWDIHLARIAEEAHEITDDDEEGLQKYKKTFGGSLRHKYAALDVECTVTVTLAGTRAQRILVTKLVPRVSKSGLLVFNTSGHVVYANAVAEQILEYRPGHLMAHDFKINKLLAAPHAQVHMRALKSLRHITATTAPCFSGRPTILIGRHHKPRAVTVRWKPMRDGDETVLVAVVHSMRAQPADDFSQGGVDETINLRMRLRTIVTEDGEVVAVHGGTGYTYKVPGGVLGLNAETMVGRSVAKYLDVVSAAVRNAQLYGNVDEQTVVQPFLRNLVTKSGELGLAAWRMSFKPHDDDDAAPIPVSLVVTPVDKSPVNANAIVANLADRQHADALAAGKAYVLDLWRTDLLEGHLETDKGFLIRHANLHAQLITGFSSPAMFGKPLSLLLPQGSSGAAGQLRTALSGQRGVKIGLAHADTGRIGASLSGDQKTSNSGKYVLLVRAFGEDSAEEHAGADGLRRVEALFSKDSGPAGAGGARRVGGGVRFAEALEENLCDDALEDALANFENTPDDDDEPESDEDPESVDGDADAAEAKSDDGDARSEQYGSETPSREMSGAGSEAGASDVHAAADFSRAKRFRRLARMLRGAKVQAIAASLQCRARLLLVALFLACFAFNLVNILMVEQYKESVVLTVDTGSTGAAIERIAILTRAIQSARDGEGWSVASKIEFEIDLDRLIADMEDDLRSAYLAPRTTGRLSEESRLLYEVPQIPAQWFRDSIAPEDSAAFFDNKNETRLYSYLGLVQNYVMAAREMRFPAAKFLGKLAPNSLPSRDSRHFDFIQKNAHEAMLRGFQAQQAAQVAAQDKDQELAQNLYLAAAIVLGIGMVPAITFVVLYMSIKLTAARIKLLDVFLKVPRHILLTLATRGVGLGEGERDEDVDWQRSALTETEKRTLEQAAGKKRKARGLGKRGKYDFLKTTRKLPNRDIRPMLVILLPMVVLLGLILGLNIGCMALIQDSGSASNAMLATDEMSDFAARVRWAAQELVLLDPAVPDTELGPNGPRFKAREFLNASATTLEHRWNGVVFGDDALDTEGQVIHKKNFQSLLFGESCLRANASSCLATDHPFYEAANQGLDAAVRAYVGAARLLGNDLQASHPDVGERMKSVYFRLLWELGRSDLVDGIDSAVRLFRQVSDEEIIVVQIVTAISILLVLLTVCVYTWMLRPFTQLAAMEAVHVAELLSELPMEMGVEGMLRAVADIQDVSDGTQMPLWRRGLKGLRQRVIRCALGTPLYVELEDQIREVQDRLAEQEDKSLLAGNRWVEQSAFPSGGKARLKKKV